MRKLIVALSGILVFSGAASCKEEPREYYPVEFPDCDADDRKGVWDTADCGPSPKPMLTAYQPKPKKTTRK